jgi:hypothetical protein
MTSVIDVTLMPGKISKDYWYGTGNRYRKKEQVNEDDRR